MRPDGGRGRRGRGGGEYNRNKYGSRGRGRGREGGGRGGDRQQSRGGPNGGCFEELKDLLLRLDGKLYGAYHDLTIGGMGWQHPDFQLFIGRVQSDPFAPPTRCRIVIPRNTARFPHKLCSNKVRAMALSDYLHRQLYQKCRSMGADRNLRGSGGWSGPKGGDLQILEPCQHVLEQTAVQADTDGAVVVQLTVNLPARGRTILGRAALGILTETLLSLIQDTSIYSSLNARELEQHVDSIEDQVWLQQQLEESELVAFIKDGAILPRASGVDDRALTMGAIPFQSPPSLQTSFVLPNTGSTITGMGLRRGITLVCGGGFHGKSTLLEALQVGVYPKIPGDGREFCVTSPMAAKIRAEDGRSVTAVDISPFITNLPFGKDTTCFSTQDASGSTSQASNIVESLESGADLLLFDEDTCATNFMVRDDKMSQLVSTEKEPITPFVRKVHSLYNERGVSSILAIGGSGDYFHVADTVLVMDCYKCLDVTERAKKIVASSNDNHSDLPFGGTHNRFVKGPAFKTSGKVSARSKGLIAYGGDIEVDVSGLEQLVCKAQTNALAFILKKYVSTRTTALTSLLDAVEKDMNENTLDAASVVGFHGGLARPRRLEIAGAINRFRQSNCITQSEE